MGARERFRRKRILEVQALDVMAALREVVDEAEHEWGAVPADIPPIWCGPRGLELEVKFRGESVARLRGGRWYLVGEKGPCNFQRVLGKVRELVGHWLAEAKRASGVGEGR